MLPTQNFPWSSITPHHRFVFTQALCSSSLIVHSLDKPGMCSIKMPASSLQSPNGPHTILAKSVNAYVLYSYSAQGTELSLEELQHIPLPGSLSLTCALLNSSWFLPPALPPALPAPSAPLVLICLLHTRYSIYFISFYILTTPLQDIPILYFIACFKLQYPHFKLNILFFT